jgi:hypothetical protein
MGDRSGFVIPAGSGTARVPGMPLVKGPGSPGKVAAMQEEVIAGIILGFWMGAPIGWFMKAALTWRRDARRATQGESKPAVPPVQPVPQLTARIESLMERLSQRLETVEDRLEFTERLLDARTPGPAQASRRLATASMKSDVPGDTRE